MGLSKSLSPSSRGEALSKHFNGVTYQSFLPLTLLHSQIQTSISLSSSLHLQSPFPSFQASSFLRYAFAFDVKLSLAFPSWVALIEITILNAVSASQNGVFISPQEAKSFDFDMEERIYSWYIPCNLILSNFCSMMIDNTFYAII